MSVRMAASPVIMGLIVICSVCRFKSQSYLSPSSGISIVWRADSWGVACRRCQLSAFKMMEMPLDGAKYGWLLNLQTLDYPKKILLAPQINFTFLHYISTEPILKQLQSEASLTAADLCSKFNFVIWGSRAKFKKRAKMRNSQSDVSEWSFSKSID